MGAQEANLVAELEVLEKAIEGRQFVAHANSILETEATTEKMAGLDLGGKDAGPLVSRLDTYYEDPDLVKGKAQLVNFPPEFAAIPCKPLFYDLALYHVAMPSLDAKLDAGKGSEGGAGAPKSDHHCSCFLRGLEAQTVIILPSYM